MRGLVGWMIIIATLAALSLALLYPGYRLARRFYPEFRKMRWVYAAAAAVCGIAVWFALPLVVHRLFERVAV